MRLGERIRQARRERGLTQAQLAEQLGITARSVQNYESGAIVPWRHISRIELLTRKRAGWLLRGDESEGSLRTAVSELLQTMEQQQAALQDQLVALQRNAELLRKQLEALPVRQRADRLG